MANGFQFVSFDGADSDGVRAEVSVSKGRGMVRSIVPHDSVPASNVEIKTEGLKFSQKGWVNNDSPVLRAAQEALDNGTEVEYRLESQRRAKVDRSIPIDDLRLDKENNGTTIRSILAGINGVYSDEMVTDPEEDPAPGGRIPARGQNRAPQNQPVQGNQNQGNQGLQNASQNIPAQGNPGPEGMQWELFNHDRTINVGSYAVQAATGVEFFVHKQMLQAGLALDNPEFDNIIRGWSFALLDMADSIQQYITGKEWNRLKPSHSRVRGVIFDTIETAYPMSAVVGKDADRNAWYSAVGKTALNRMRMIMDLNRPALDPRNKASMYDLDTFLGRSAPQSQNDTQQGQNRPPESSNAQEPAGGDSGGKAVTDAAVMSARPDPNVNRGEDADKSDWGLGAEATEAGNGLDALRQMSDSSVVIMPQNHVAAVNNQPSPNTIEALTSLMDEAQIGKPELATVLNYTFGQSKVVQIPEDQMEEFIDFYVGTEMNSPGNLKKVVEFIQQDLSRS